MLPINHLSHNIHHQHSDVMESRLDHPATFSLFYLHHIHQRLWDVQQTEWSHFDFFFFFLEGFDWTKKMSRKTKKIFQRASESLHIFWSRQCRNITEKSEIHISLWHHVITEWKYNVTIMYTQGWAISWFSGFWRFDFWKIWIFFTIVLNMSPQLRVKTSTILFYSF